jgi:hypothetical protein
LCWEPALLVDACGCVARTDMLLLLLLLLPAMTYF